MGWTVLLSGIFALFRIWEKPSTWTTATAGILLLLLTTDARFAFNYQATFSMLAIAFCTLTNDRRPLLQLLVILYLSSGLHKLVNFETMIVSLPNSLIKLMPNEFYTLYNLPVTHMAKISAYLIIPIELTIGLLLYVSRTRAAGFVLSAFFHSFVGIMMVGDQVLTVGFKILSLHAALACFDTRLNWGSLFESHRIRWLVSSFILSLVLYQIDDGLFALNTILKIYGFYGPLIFLSWYAYYSKIEIQFQRPQKILTSHQPNSFPMWLLCSLLILWSVAPVLNHYRNTSLGWAMFSGAEMKVPSYCLETPKSECFNYPALDPIIRLIDSHPDRYLYKSKQASSLDLFSKYLLRKCLSETLSVRFCEAK